MRLAPPIATLVALATASACEEPFDIGAEGLIAHVVVDARMQSGLPPRVSVRAIDVYGSPAAGAPVDESFVTLETSDGRTLDLELVGGGARPDSLATFSTLDPSEIVVVGVTYRLRVETPGFARLGSETTVPPRADLEFASARPDSVEYEPVTYEEGSSRLSLGFALDDASPATNYYHLLVTAIDSAQEAPLAFSFARNLSDVTDLGRGGILISDRAFTRGRLDNRIVVDVDQDPTVRPQRLRVEVRVVSTPYFDFVSEGGYGTQQLLGSTVGRGRAEGNIVGGLGVFGSYSSTEGTIALDR